MLNYTRLKELNILYVEDELPVLEEVEAMLKLKVGKIYTATNGEKGFKKYQEKKIDIIITDVAMPVMNGLEMVDKIRQINKSIPIIITTAFNEGSFFEKAIDLHVDKYITKPINIFKLFAILNRASEVIFQKREIIKRDSIIKTILNMHPYYTLLVDKNNLEKINQDLLAFLGYKNNKDFKSKNMDMKNLLKLLTSMQNNKDGKSIYLIPKDEKVIKYFLKPYSFNGLELFLIVFFEFDKIKKQINSTKDLDLCRICNISNRGQDE